MSGTAGPWERELVARVAAGDDAALARLYDQYAPVVYGIALRVVRDGAAAADVTQEVFLSLWQRPASYDPDRGPLRVWIACVARRRALDAVRVRARADRREERLGAEPVVQPPNVEEAATALVLGEKVRRAVELLPPDQRVAVELAYFAGLTFREVAEALRIPEGTAKSRLRLGLARLAATLREEAEVGWT